MSKTDMETSKIVVNALTELRKASLEYGPNASKLYGILFLGGEFNIIYSNELNSLLNRHYNLDVSNNELNKLLPNICENLKMKCNLLKSIDDTPSTTYIYEITLR